METEGEVHSFVNGETAVYTSRTPENQTPNEDCAALFAIDSHAGVLVVADGMGGMPLGKEASHLCINAIQSSLESIKDPYSGLREVILNGIEQANQEVSGLNVGAASTLAIVEIVGDLVRPYHIGDSSILVVGQKGKVKLYTVSHSPVGYAVEAGFLDESEAMHHEERHIVSNMIGSADMRIEVGPTLKLAPKDTLLIASDGLFDNFQLDEIQDRIRKGSLRTIMQALINEARRRMVQPIEGYPSKPDDLTFILYRQK